MTKDIRKSKYNRKNVTQCTLRKNIKITELVGLPLLEWVGRVSFFGLRREWLGGWKYICQLQTYVHSKYMLTVSAFQEVRTRTWRQSDELKIGLNYPRTESVCSEFIKCSPLFSHCFVLPQCILCNRWQLWRIYEKSGWRILQNCLARSCPLVRSRPFLQWNDRNSWKMFTVSGDRTPLHRPGLAPSQRQFVEIDQQAVALW